MLDFIKALLTWWFIVEPWEQAVRVRFGKHVRLFAAGAHIRIPFFDNIYVQNTRRRLLSVGSQTLTTSDRKVLTVHSTIGYVITDILKLQRGLHDADGTIMQHISALLARDIAGHRLKDCGPTAVAARVKADLNLCAYGLDVVEFALTSYVADVRTLRILNDTAAPYFGYTQLNTVVALGMAGNTPSAGSTSGR
jgi:hypothetical protein